MIPDEQYWARLRASFDALKEDAACRARARDLLVMWALAIAIGVAAVALLWLVITW